MLDISWGVWYTLVMALRRDNVTKVTNEVVTYHVCCNVDGDRCTAHGIVKVTRDAEGKVVSWHHVKEEGD